MSKLHQPEFSPQPPRWADRLLAWWVNPYLLEEVQGDLHERYYKRIQEVGVKQARREYISSVFGFLRRFGFKPQPGQYTLSNQTDMFFNYLIIALRGMKRSKIYSFINIAGLSVGLACCMLIFLYTKDELSFDRFHENKDRIFRVGVNFFNEDEVSSVGSTNMIVGPTFKQEIPEIETYIRMQAGNYTVKLGTETYNQEVLAVDENFFSVFSFPLLSGKATEVLTDPNSLVLSEEAAQKFFGTTEAVGKTLELDINGSFKPFVISGIAKNPPQNSSIQFSMLSPLLYDPKAAIHNEWVGFYINTFVVLHPQANFRTVVPKMNQVFRRYAREEIVQTKANLLFDLQPLLQLHLDTEFGDIRNGLANGSKPIYSYILSGIALFILLIACFNFVNLTTAHSLKRGKEIGVRKVMGGKRGQLMGQFLSESYLTCLLAFVLAILLVVPVLPFFNELVNKQLSFSYLLDWKLILWYTLLYAFTGLIAGFYPALVLSGFNPVQTLYSRHTFTNKNYLTKTLVVVQFALATFLMITTIGIYNQFDYLTHKDLGYNDDHVVYVHLGRRMDGQLVKQFKNELAKEPAVQMVAAKNSGQNYTLGEIKGKEIGFAISWIDENYLPALQIPLVAGRNFSTGFPTDAEQAIIVNESFVREAGWQDAIGKTVFNVNGKQKNMTVIGVVKDHHFVSLREKIGPQLFVLGGGDLWVKIQPDRIPQALQAIEKTYHQLLPYRPYEYVFLDSMHAQAYEEEAKWKQMITVGAVLTLLIACIGLFGLATLSMIQRSKEIGIRKVFGASVNQIVALVSKDFVKLVLMAFLIATPAAWYAMNTWLENFAYRILVSWEIFAAAGILALCIALLTISFQSLKAAVANPVKSLRNE